MNDRIADSPRVKIGFHKSSQKGGEWGADIELFEGATYQSRVLTDAEDIMDAVAMLRRRAQAIIDAKVDEDERVRLIEELEASLAEADSKSARSGDAGPKGMKSD